MSRKARKINAIFICVHNSARSQMGEAFMKMYGSHLFDRIESAGLEAGTLNPLTVQVMKESGIDISRARTKAAIEFVQKGVNFDYVITMSDLANSEAVPIFPGLNIRVTWSFPDPAQFKGSEEEKLAALREIRNGIEENVKQLALTVKKKHFEDSF